MARPDKIKKIQLFLLIAESPACALVRNTIPQAIITTTTVRTAVARFESTPSMPTFAKIEVKAAKVAEKRAYKSQVLCVETFSPCFFSLLLV